MRVAEHQGHVYLDLTDEHWRAVEIGPEGWQVIPCPPVADFAVWSTACETAFSAGRQFLACLPDKRAGLHRGGGRRRSGCGSQGSRESSRRTGRAPIAQAAARPGLRSRTRTRLASLVRGPRCASVIHSCCGGCSRVRYGRYQRSALGSGAKAGSIRTPANEHDRPESGPTRLGLTDRGWPNPSHAKGANPRPRVNRSLRRAAPSDIAAASQAERNRVKRVPKSKHAKCRERVPSMPRIV